MTLLSTRRHGIEAKTSGLFPLIHGNHALFVYGNACPSFALIETWFATCFAMNGTLKMTGTCWEKHTWKERINKGNEWFTRVALDILNTHTQTHTRTWIHLTVVCVSVTLHSSCNSNITKYKKYKIPTLSHAIMGERRGGFVTSCWHFHRHSE